MKTIAALLVVLLLVVPCTGDSQGLQGTLEKLAKDAAIGYVNPIVSGFGADLNSGWMYRAPQATMFGLDFDIGFVFMGALMSDDAKKFSRSGVAVLDQATVNLITTGLTTVGGFRDSVRSRLYGREISIGISGPTVVGSKTDSIRFSYAGAPVTFPSPYTGQDTTLALASATQVLPVTGLLEDLSILPMFAPQLSIGTIYGTKVAFRYLPEIEVSKDIGKFSYFGFGIQHNPFMWIPVPEPPLDVSLGFFTQTMKVGSIFETNATMFGVQASKTFGPGILNITPYGGFAFESSSMTFTYTWSRPNPFNPTQTILTPISFELEGENSVRLTIGAMLKLAVFKLNADYNIAKFNTFSAGFGFIF